MTETEPAAIFDTWSALSILSASLRKKVHLTLGRIRIYPNIYVVLVAEPGVARKSQAINYAMEFISYVSDIVTTADSITREALLEDLEASAVDEQMLDGSIFRHTSVSIISKEFEAFLGQKGDNTKMIVLLTDLFDAQEIPWRYRTKRSGSNVVPSVFLSMYAATTPESLASSLPSIAVGGGLTSRILFVWAEDKKKKVPQPKLTEEEKKLKEQLQRELHIISRIVGTYQFTPDCSRKWDEWYLEYDERDPCRICNDRSFNGWYSRKPTYLLKISILCAAAKSQNLIITWEDIKEAMGFIEEIEGSMGEVFRAIGKSQISAEVDMALQIIKNRGWITEKQIMSLMYRDADADKFDNVINTAIRTGKVKRSFLGPKHEAGDIWYVWVGKGV